MKLIFKKIAYSIISILGIIVLLTLTSVGSKESSSEVEIFLISNDIHIGIVVPVKNQVYDWQGLFPNESNLDWVEFGWGDRRFYFEMPTWEHFTLELVADALFIPDPAVLHVGFLKKHPTAYANVRKVKISFETYEKIVKAIQAEVVLKNSQPILIPDKGYTPLDNFYEAYGSYSIIKTCNVWTSDIFAQAGLKHPLWSPTKYGLEFMW